MEKNVFKCFLIMNFYNTIDKNLYNCMYFHCLSLENKRRKRFDETFV